MPKYFLSIHNKILFLCNKLNIICSNFIHNETSTLSTSKCNFPCSKFPDRKVKEEILEDQIESEYKR